jgi:hypothetical protein
MKLVSSLTATLLMTALLCSGPAGLLAAEDWTPLFDGKSLVGWKVAEHPDAIRAEDSMIVCSGPRAHAFYVGPVQGADFRNFELKATLMTRGGADSGIYFHTEYQEQGVPTKGYEAQINNTVPGPGNHDESAKTGSLHGVRNQYKSLVEENQWFTLHLAVTGKRIRVWVNDTLVVDYTEPARPVRNQALKERLLSHGTFALEWRDARGEVLLKSIDVKPLSDDLSVPPADQSVVDQTYSQIMRLQQVDFPLIDFHVHLKGGLTLEQALANSRRVGINYGIAPNCGLGFPITNDAGIYQFLEAMKGQPVFLGMQAEGREWVKMFSKQAIERFDYVFTDAMTFTDDRGKRIRLWINQEVNIDDEQAFMDMYVDRIVSVLNHEPIDVYVNATFLPAQIARRYDELWTEQRMDKVIDAAVNNKVAIEINASSRIPSPRFIKRAKQAGVKFTFGTNNAGRNLGRLQYCLDMIQQCGLSWQDMFMPKRRTPSAAPLPPAAEVPVSSPEQK